MTTRKTPTLRTQIERHLQQSFPFSRFIVTGERGKPNVFHIDVNPPDVDSLTASVKPASTYARAAVRRFGGKFMDASAFMATWRPGSPRIGAWFTLVTDPPVVIEEPPNDPENDTQPDIKAQPPITENSVQAA